MGVLMVVVVLLVVLRVRCWSVVRLLLLFLLDFLHFGTGASGTVYQRNPGVGTLVATASATTTAQGEQFCDRASSG